MISETSESFSHRMGATAVAMTMGGDVAELRSLAREIDLSRDRSLARHPDSNDSASVQYMHALSHK